MSREQFDKLLQYIDARVLELIEQENRRDSTHEYLKRCEIVNELEALLVDKDL
jgi:hypothetical protein